MDNIGRYFPQQSIHRFGRLVVSPLVSWQLGVRDALHSRDPRCILLVQENQIQDV